jgi:hypothetical protein
LKHNFNIWNREMEIGNIKISINKNWNHGYKVMKQDKP